MSPLLFILDEGQVLASQKNFAPKMLQLRHAGICLSLNVQNPSKIPVEILGNCDAFFTFQLTDGRDRRAIARSFGSTRSVAPPSRFGFRLRIAEPPDSVGQTVPR